MNQELILGGSTANAYDNSDDNSVRREKIMGLLRGRLHWAIILALLLGGGFGYLAYNSVEPEYKSMGKVRVSAPDSLVGRDTGVDMDRWAGFVKEQEALIASEQVATKALRSEPWLSREGGPADLSVSDFQSAIDLDLNENNNRDNVFTLGFFAADPDTAAAGCNALLEAYKEVYTARNSDIRSEELNNINRGIMQTETRIDELKAIRGTILDDGDAAQLRNNLNFHNAHLLDLETRLDTIEAQIAAYTPTSVDGRAPTSDEMVAADPILRDLQGLKERLDGEIRALELEGKGPAHRNVAQLINQREVILRNMEDRKKLIASSEIPLINDDEFEQLRNVERVLTRQIAETTTKIERLNEVARQIAGIEEDMQRQIDLLNDLSIDKRNAIVNAGAFGREVSIVGRGAKPSSPSNAGSDVQMGAAAGMGGAALGVGLVMLLGLMDRRLRHAGDAKTGMPQARMLGILPTLPENFADPEQSERASHAVHHIRTLLQIANGGTARVFSITSPAAGSGKSSLTVALGLSFAASESRTLVIDCDLVGAGLTRRVGAVVNRTVENILREDTTLTDQQIEKALETSRDRGIHLKDALIELGLLTKKDLARLNRRQTDSALGVLDACHGRPFSECVADTGVENFHILPIGAAKPHDAGQLSPKAMRSLIERARQEFDIVLIDTGPCLGSLEASMAASEVDATVLIVSRGDAKSMAVRAYEHLQSVGANVAGVVFNHALETDLNHSSYASIVSQERRTDPSQSVMTADPAIAARFGPLGSAVAAFGRPSRSPNGKPRKPVVAASNNGH
jgi:Mrp family chromosome partitioning ATPase